MLGEDGESCLGVRARCKGPNRALLGLLLHGHTRVVGVREGSGALGTHAEAQLLVDEDSGAPVLFVHCPQGDLDRVAEVRWHLLMTPRAAEGGLCCRCTTAPSSWAVSLTCRWCTPSPRRPTSTCSPLGGKYSRERDYRATQT